jgi:hypothetical protein
MEAQFTLGGKAQPLDARLFGSEEITAVRDGKFSAFFAPYEVKVFFLTME